MGLAGARRQPSRAWRLRGPVVEHCQLLYQMAVTRCERVVRGMVGVILSIGQAAKCDKQPCGDGFGELTVCPHSRSAIAAMLRASARHAAPTAAICCVRGASVN